MNLRAFIADDERHARARVRALLAREDGIDVVGEAATGDEAIRGVAEERPDLLFLDVQMPPPNGLEVLRVVRETWLPCTIFTTAHAEYALDAFSVRAFDYLLKPFSPERFHEALQRARSQIGLQRDRPDKRVLAALEAADGSAGHVSRLLVRTNDRYVVVPVSEIDWLEAASNYLIAHTAGRNHVLRKSVTAIESELNPRQFFRVSRGAIVQLAKVREIQAIAAGEHVVILEGGSRVPMTRGLRELQERLGVVR